MHRHEQVEFIHSVIAVNTVECLCPPAGQGQNLLLRGEENLLIALLKTCTIELITSHLESLTFYSSRLTLLAS